MLRFREEQWIRFFCPCGTMAFACCVHQVASTLVGSSNGLKQPTVALRTPWLKQFRLSTGSHSSPPLLTKSFAVAVAQTTAATTPDSGLEAPADKVQEELQAAEEEQPTKEQEEEEEVKEMDREPKLKKTKSLVHILEALHKQAIEEATKDREIPDIRPGYVVQIRMEAPETKRRVSLLRGIVICRRNNGVNTTFTIRRIIAGVGVEMVIPLYSPNVKEITVLKRKKVRRAKLYYLRNKLAKFSTF